MLKNIGQKCLFNVWISNSHSCGTVMYRSCVVLYKGAKVCVCLKNLSVSSYRSY